MCCLLVMVLVVPFERMGSEAFAPGPALWIGGPCCWGAEWPRPSGEGRRDARVLLAMKKEEGGGANKPIKRVCATNKYVRTPNWIWVRLWSMIGR